MAVPSRLVDVFDLKSLLEVVMKMRVFSLLTLVAAAVVLTSAPSPTFTARDKAFYANERTVNFVRPGLAIKIESAALEADGTIKARIRLTDLRGLPLDRLGVTTPGAVSVSLIAGPLRQNALV